VRVERGPVPDELIGVGCVAQVAFDEGARLVEEERDHGQEESHGFEKKLLLLARALFRARLAVGGSVGDALVAAAGVAGPAALLAL
jgi:hypothetical protein